MGAISAYAISSIVGAFLYAFYFDTDQVALPGRAFPYLCAFAGLVAILAGIHSYRATIRRYRGDDTSSA